MTALLHHLLSDHPHGRRVQVPERFVRAATPVVVPLAATAERLATRNELDALHSLHPRRIAVGR